VNAAVRPDIACKGAGTGRVYDRFSEGFETVDLESAKTLLDALGHAQ
jgi:hypothetical protein